METLPPVTFTMDLKKIAALTALLVKELKDAMAAMGNIEFAQDPGEFLLLSINYDLLAEWTTRLRKKREQSEIKMKMTIAQATAFFSFWRLYDYFPVYEGTALNQIVAAIDQQMLNLKNKIIDINGEFERITELPTWESGGSAGAITPVGG